MNEPAFGIDLPHLRVYWRIERPLAELSPPAALDAASTRLLKSQASIQVSPHEAAIKFGWTWRAGRSWLACISSGAVQASRNGELLAVTVGASLIPLVLFAAVGGLAVGASGLGTAWLIGVVALLLVGNYLSVHFGLLGVAAAVAGAAPASGAA